MLLRPKFQEILQKREERKQQEFEQFKPKLNKAVNWKNVLQRLYQDKLQVATATETVATMEGEEKKKKSTISLLSSNYPPNISTEVPRTRVKVSIPLFCSQSSNRNTLVITLR